MSNQTNKIIIIGAGYAGLVALQKLDFISKKGCKKIFS
jgi:NADH dehydrogenase FAD-containing subunit